MRRPKSQIAVLRENRGLKKSDLARRLRISNTALRNLEEDCSIAYNIVKLILLCRLLSCQIQDLLPQSHNDFIASEVSREQIHHQLCSEENLASLGERNRTRLPELLNELHASKGITQRDISAALDVAKSTIQNWENGRYPPALLFRCVMICEIFNCCIEELVDYIPQKQESGVQKLIEMPIKSKIPARKNLDKIRSKFENSISRPSGLKS